MEGRRSAYKRKEGRKEANGRRKEKKETGGLGMSGIMKEGRKGMREERRKEYKQE